VVHALFELKGLLLKFSLPLLLRLSLTHIKLRLGVFILFVS
jgi:hypothetical protein